MQKLIYDVQKNKIKNEKDDKIVRYIYNMTYKHIKSLLSRFIYALMHKVVQTQYWTIVITLLQFLCLIYLVYTFQQDRNSVTIRVYMLRT